MVTLDAHPRIWFAVGELSIELSEPFGQKLKQTSYDDSTSSNEKLNAIQSRKNEGRKTVLHHSKLKA